MFANYIVCFAAAFQLADLIAAQSDAEIRSCSEEIWAADTNRITGNDVQYDANGPVLFTYVNEARFTGTYAAMLTLFDNYTPETEVTESCGQTCRNEEDAFLTAVLDTQPMQILHTWLVGQGLASADVNSFKDDLKQYWFMPYTRSGGALGSTGFEHTFLGEIDNNAVSGFHNWVHTYFEEKQGDYNYGNYQNTCTPEILKFGFQWLGYNKPVSSMFMRSSPEAEMALYTLCLLARMGNACPIRLAGTQLTMTAWDMTGLPTTIGSAYPNC